jgi:HSP20 family protein
MTDELQTEKQEVMETKGAERTRASRVFVPKADIYASNGDIILLVDMPGVDESDLDITLEKNQLTIYGFVPPSEPEGYELAHSEYGIGDYQRSFTLSDEIDQDNIEASLRNGVLRLVLPKAPEAKARKITIKAN